MSSAVIGIGNKLRCDDGAGLFVVETIAPRLPPGTQAISASKDCTLLLDEWQKFDTVFLVDALQGAGNAGNVLRFDASQSALPFQSVRSSTHAMSIGEAIELARNLGQLPGKIVVYGIVGENFSMGEELSTPVRTAIDTVCARILKELET